jgi:hypothetical protein
MERGSDRGEWLWGSGRAAPERHHAEGIPQHCERQLWTGDHLEPTCVGIAGVRALQPATARLGAGVGRPRRLQRQENQFLRDYLEE